MRRTVLITKITHVTTHLPHSPQLIKRQSRNISTTRQLSTSATKESSNTKMQMSFLSYVSSVGTVTTLRAIRTEKSNFDFQQEQEIFHFPKRFRQAVGGSPSHITKAHWVVLGRGQSDRGVRVTNHLPLVPTLRKMVLYSVQDQLYPFSQALK